MVKEKKGRKKAKVKSSKLPFRREFSAGGVVFKKNKVLLIKPAGTNRWQLPKGHIEEKEKSAETARREVKEETGVEAKVIEKIGDTKYFFVLKGTRIFKVVSFFLMKFEKQGEIIHKNEVDDVKFLPFDEAVKTLTYKDDRQITKKAKFLFDRL